jgi:nitrile hydratase accessory protein
MSTEDRLQQRLAATGAAMPPMENGELLFAEPWEARAFGMAHHLCDAGCFEWDAFRDHLIAVIAAHDARPANDEPYCYYEHWLVALEQTLADHGLAEHRELDARAHELAARPHGHDH